MSNRKRKILTLEERVKVVKLNEKGDSARKIATLMDVGKTQIQSIIKDKETVINQWENGTDGKRKILHAKRSLFCDLNDRVYEWFCSARSKNIPISGKLIQEKALTIALEMNNDDFMASNGWLQKFQARHNIKCTILSGESAEVDPDVVEDWSKRLANISAGYELRNIFNCDETGLFFRLLPSRSLVEKGQTCHGGKKSKERFTVLLCASATGEKIKPVVIGKSKNPRSFKAYHKNNLHVHYESNRKAWMTTEIFTAFLKRLNNFMRIQGRKILLFVDNCSSHPKIHLSNIQIAFFPPNTTSRLQPMDAGIIQNVKMVYRKKLLRHVLFLMDSASNASEIAKNVSILDGIQWLVFAWDTLAPETIVKCFMKCGFDKDNLTGKFVKF